MICLAAAAVFKKGRVLFYIVIHLSLVSLRGRECTYQHTVAVVVRRWRDLGPVGLSFKCDSLCILLGRGVMVVGFVYSLYWDCRHGRRVIIRLR